MLSAQSSTAPSQPPIEALRLAVAAEQELRRRKRSWQPTFRGASAQAQEIEDHEWMSCGPAESAKTWGICWRLDTLARATPRGRGLIVRKVRADMTASVLVTFERVAGFRGAPEKFGGADVRWYDYPNGFRLYVVGLDRAGKVLSGEFDFIYINQAEELSLSDWETLSTRCTGRGSISDTPMIFGDCNPGPPNHWILKRTTLTRLYASHQDNPTLYDDAGNLTAQGVKTMEVLDALTGVRQKRLRDGLWVAAEGVVYDGFDRAVHLIPRFEIPNSWRRVGAIDFGFQNPFVYLEAAINHDGAIFIDFQFYRTQRLVEDWARIIVAERAERQLPKLEVCVSDHDTEDRVTLARHGFPTRPAVKEIELGIQKVAARLRKGKDGKARLFIFEDSLVERDPELAEAHKPCSLVDEFEVYRYPDGVDGKPLKEKPIDVDNHAMDSLRYLVEYVDGRSAPERPLEERVADRVDQLKQGDGPVFAGGVPVDATAAYRKVMQVVADEKKRTTNQTPGWARGLGRRLRKR